MDRPSRKSKVVNYCEAKDVDDEDDFAFVKAPPSKKAREEKNTREHKKSSHGSGSEINQKSRVPLDERLHERDLEAALVLSLLNTEAGQKEESCQGVAKARVVVDENTDPTSLKFSNCSVDSVKIGLDTIWSEKDTERNAAENAKQGAEKVPRKTPREDDDDYEPKLTPDSGSDDDDYSEAPESEDEEFKVAETRKKGKVTKNLKSKQIPASKKEKPASKVSKSKSQTAASAPARTPPAAKLAPKRPALSSTPRPASALSPAAGRVPKWTPPGQIGRSPTSSTVPAVKSPGQGLRLGLSRLVRVKPLHPSVASH